MSTSEHDATGAIGTPWPTQHPDPLRAAVYQALNRIDRTLNDESGSARYALEQVERLLSGGLITSERQAAAWTASTATASAPQQL